jgi:ribosome maturation protein SDO1
MKMVDVDKAVIAKIKKEGMNFEVLVDCDNALLLRSGKDIEISDVLASEQVFSDAGKGLAASETQMNSVFGTNDASEVAKHIIMKGEIQITAEHRKKLLEQKKRRILDYISRNSVDPKTGLPHPVKRLELAFDEARVHIDEYKSVERQVQDIIKMLRPVLPISFEKKEIAIKIPPKYAAKGYSAVQGFGNIKKQDWQSDGSWLCVIEIPAGMQNDLFDRLNSMTHGEVETKELSSSG